MRVELGFEEVEQGAQSGIRDPRGIAVRDGETWGALWQEHTAGVDPPLPVPEVDFGREMVVAFFLGERPTGGYSVEIVRIILWPDGLVVRVAVTQPESGEIVPQVLTQPFHIVRVKRVELPVLFETLER